MRRKDDALTREVMAYFADKEAHFAPSQIDWAMGLASGTAHDIIVRKWARDRESDSGRLSSYHEQL